MDNRVVLGIDIGGTKTAAALLDREGQVIEETKKGTECADVSSLLGSLDEVIRVLFESAAVKKLTVAGIGLGIAGLVDFGERALLFAPNLGLKRFLLGSIIEEKFRTPTLVDNDANCTAWAEKLFGASKDAKNSICVTLGTGIGGGIIIDGRLYRGTVGSAGEIGHMTIDVNGPRCACGRLGCFEALASASALVARAISEVERDSLILELVNGKRQSISGEVITEAAKEGDVFARKILREHGKIIGIGFANLINLFDPEVIVVGGGLAAASEFLLPAVQEEVDMQVMVSELRKTRIVEGRLGQKAGMVGAAMLVFEELVSKEA